MQRKVQFVYSVSERKLSSVGIKHCLSIRATDTHKQVYHQQTALMFEFVSTLTRFGYYS